MPIYEFQCDTCQHIFEELVFDEKTPACPKCYINKTKKLISCACVHGSKSGAASGKKASCVGCSGGSCATCH